MFIIKATSKSATIVLEQPFEHTGDFFHILNFLTDSYFPYQITIEVLDEDHKVHGEMRFNQCEVVVHNSQFDYANTNTVQHLLQYKFNRAHLRSYKPSDSYNAKC